MSTASPALIPAFAISVTNMLMDVNENTDLGEEDYEKATPEQIRAAVKVQGDAANSAAPGVAAGMLPDTGMYRLSIILQA